MRGKYADLSAMLHEFLHELFVVWMGWVQDWGYWGIILLMAMESSIFPVPSELVIPPAAILVAKGQLGYWGVVFSGTFGSWLGSAITYSVSRWLGRPMVMKWGKYFFMPPAKVEKAEIFLQRYEKGGIFFSRLLPVIRHLISIPAGLVRMNFWIFSVITILGSFLWCLILTWYGHRVGSNNPNILDSPEELVNTVKHESFGLIVAIAALTGLYFLMLHLTKKRSAVRTDDRN